MKRRNSLFAIFGDPVSHSVSPLMHNYAFSGLGFPGCYTRYRLAEGSQLRRKFLDLSLSGVNVTVPHKEAAYLACDEVRGIAREIEAVNTIIREEGKLIGYNTDAPGFLKSALAFGEIRSVAILGAGGTAKALAAIFRREGVETAILNRSSGRLEYFVARGYRACDWEQWKPKAYDLVVNTTSAGLQEQTLPAPGEILEPLLRDARYAIDVIYNRQTPFLQLAKTLGKPAKDGSEMLLYQGVIAFDHFTAHRYDEEEITRWMRRAFA